MTRKKITAANGAASLPSLYVIASLIASVPDGACAADMALPQPEPAAAPDNPIADYFAAWYDRVDAAQASQPHWMTPITTTTPRLDEEYHYDQLQQFLQNGGEINNYFAGKGVELIPTETNQVNISLGGFEQRVNHEPATGFTDANFLLVKQRLLSANEENGNYILTAFLGIQAPTGITAFTNRPAWIVTPTLAGGIGFGDFDVQGTIGYTLPTDELNHVGNTLLSSVTFQYHLGEYLWPEFALNDTQWTSGERVNRNQLLIGPGIVFGRFQIYKRVKLIFGIAYQVAVVPDHAITDPLTPLFNHGWDLSVRLTF